MSDLPDKDLDEILADPRAREILNEMLKMSNADQPLDELPREAQRDLATLMLRAMYESHAEQAAAIPEDLVNEVFADPNAAPILKQVMDHHKIPGEARDLPMEDKREMVQMLIEQGVIQFDEDPNANNGP